MERSRQKYLQSELESLDKSVAKRTGQLREAEKSLKEVNSDLKAAKEQVSSSTYFFFILMKEYKKFYTYLIGCM